MGCVLSAKQDDVDEKVHRPVTEPFRTHTQSTTDNNGNKNLNQTHTESVQPPMDTESLSASLGSDVMTSNQDQIDDIKQEHDEIDNLLDDEMTLLTQKQSDKLKQDGYCMIDHESPQQKVVYIVEGYVRQNYSGDDKIKDLIKQIIYYYGSRYNPEIFMEIVCDKVNPQYFLVPRRYIKLSVLLSNEMDTDPDTKRIEMDDEKVQSESLHHVLKYLGHHKGVEPDPLPCPVRSIHMNQIVSDQWDATFIDGFEKKAIFEIIMTARHLQIQCLTHLGCAKIATLIKQLDQKEINRIIEEEEKYRREHAEDNDNKDDNDDGGNNKNDEEKDDVLETNGNDNINDPQDGDDEIGASMKPLGQSQLDKIIENDVLESNENDDFVETAVKNEKAMLNDESIGNTGNDEVEIKRKCTDLINSEQYENDVGINEKNE